MFVGRKYPLYRTLYWTKQHILTFSLISSVPVLIYYFTPYGGLVSMPWLPVSLIGIAVAFYLGFKNNASYERLWEARKIWGGIVNLSRTFTVMSKGYIRNNFDITEEIKLIHSRLIKRHIGWLHALRFQLRENREWEHTQIKENNRRDVPPTEEKNGDLKGKLTRYFSGEELKLILSKTNCATHILDLQMKELTELRRKDFIDDFRHMELGNVIKDLYDHQGKCERIKNFPFPRQYASLTVYFIWLFILLLPFGLVQEFAKISPQFVWLTIPFAVIISWVFHSMELIGDYSENPFEGLNNDVPITAITRSIEIDLLELLDKKEIPKPMSPKHNILM